MKSDMATALVAIGVGKTTGGFHELKGAAQDARQIYDWGLTQGFDCHLFTDEEQDVEVSAIYKRIDALVDKGIFSQIVVYFSGHGVLLAPDCELWLMSGAPRHSNEVINVCGSIQAARSTGIEHIVFISDACRSLPTDMTTSGLFGQTIFRNRGVRRVPFPEVDVFYATTPGDVALEVPPDLSNVRDRGLLTECMLNALLGNVPSVIDTRPHAGGTSRVVPCYPLKKWLTSEVPRAAARIAWHLQQQPEIRIESDAVKYLAKLSETTDVSELDVIEEPARQQESSRVTKGGRGFGLVASRASGNPVLSAAIMGRLKSRLPSFETFSDYSIDGIESGQDSLLAAESRAGIVVQGGEVCTAMSAFGQISPWPGPKAQWRFFPPVEHGTHGEMQPISLRFANGRGIVVPLIPGYIATVNLAGGGVASIRYRLTRTARRLASTAMTPGQADRSLALFAAKAKAGVFTVDDVPSDSGKLLSLVCNDPMAAVYVGYGLARAGKYERIEALANKVQQHLNFVPPDLAVLAGQLGDFDFPSVSHGMPLLTQGWLMLGRFEDHLPEKITRARARMHASLWATFSEEGMDELEGYFFGG